ncbi:MAG: PKD domain-containing protein [Bacteroidetes bacterium]|nr:PKD domain-containing protein [Bacteroidota bacterium]
MRSPLLLICFLFSISVYAQEPVFSGTKLKSQVAAELDESFTHYDVFQIDFEQIDQFVKEEYSHRKFNLQLGNEFDFQFDIIANDLRWANFVIREATADGDKFLPKGEIVTYEGTLQGDPESEVRLTIDNDLFFGYVKSGKKTWYIEPVYYMVPDGPKDQLIVYQPKDVVPVPGNACTMTETHNHLEDVVKHTESNPQKTVLGDCYSVKLALMSDGFMFTKYGSSPAIANRLLGIINNVQGNFFDIFEDDFVFEVTEIYIVPAPNMDPWPVSPDIPTLFNNFVGWAPNGFLFPHDLGQLWSFREFPFPPAFGQAVQAGLCAEPPNGYSVVMDYYFTANDLRRAASHMFGHNFNATHQGAAPNSIMATDFFNPANDWDPVNITEINDNIPNLVCLMPCENLPEIPGFTSNITTLCPGSMVTFYDQSIGEPGSWDWSFPGGTPATSTNRNPTVTYNTPGTYSVSLTISSPNGPQTLTIPGYINVSPAGGSDFFYLQGFENGLQGWTIDNPDGDKTWTVAQVATARQGNGLTMFVDNGAYNGFNNRDALISPVFNFIGRDMVSLEFDYAYAKRTANNIDSLKVYISTDGGNTYPDVVFAGAETGFGGTFATRPLLNEIFYPLLDTDWCFAGDFGPGCISIDLTDYAQSPNIRIKIENVANYGNTMFIDNVRLVSDCYVPVPPIADFTASPTEGCAPLVVQYTNMSTNLPTSYIWNFPGGIPSTSTDPNPIVTYTGVGSFDVSLTVINGAGTNTLTFPDYITVETPPFASFTYALNGDAIDFTSTSSANATSFLWDFGDGSMSTEENPSHVYDEEGFYLVTLTVSNSCGSNTFFSGLLYLLPPEADFSADPTDGCIPLEVQFTNESSETANAWEWSFPGGTPSASNEENPLITYNTPGTYDVSLIVYNPVGSDTISMNNLITVDEGPTADFTVAVDESTITLTNLSTNANSYEWDFGDGETSTDENPIYTYPEDGEYLVTLIAFNDCGPDTLSIPVVILTLPTADFSASPTDGCAPLTVDFTNLSSDNALSYAWEFPGGNPSSSTDVNPSVVYENAGTYSVTLIATNDSGSDTLTMTDLIFVDDVPDASFTSSTTDLTVDFTNTTVNGDTYFWDFGDGNTSTDTDPSNTYDTDGVYDVTLIATNACGSDTIMQQVSAGAAPIAAFMAKNSEGCAPLEVEFYDESIGSVDSYEWTFPGGNPASSTLQDPVVIYDTPGVYDVTLSVTNPLGTSTITEMEIVVVGEEPTADFSAIVNNLTADFTDNSTDVANYFWEFGDGAISNETDPSHTYDMDGDYTVTLIVTNECGADTATQVITILTPPTAGFSASNSEGCVPLEVSFTDESSENVTGWSWDFPGGTPSSSNDANPVVTYNTAGTYDVTLTVTNAAGDNTVTQTGLVIVGDVPTADFSFSGNGTQVAFSNLSLDGDTFDWDFGDGDTSTDTDPIHTYDMDGQYEVSLITTNECGADTLTQTVNVVTPPVAAFSVNNNVGCAPLEVAFTDESSENVTEWLWSFPGGNPVTSSDPNPVITYDAAGVYNVTLTVSNAAGESTISLTGVVVVDDVPDAAFTNVVNGTIVDFTNTSTNANSYEWQFGDGDSSTDTDPSHEYTMDGEYEVLLIAFNDCGPDTSTQLVTITTPPLAGFSVDTTTGCVPLTVQFMDDSSENTTAWNWSFPGGTPASSTDQNPEVTYDSPGTYDVTLEVSNAAGMNSITEMAYIVVNDLPEASFTTTINGDQVDFSSTISGATEILWEFGDGETSMEENPTYIYPEDGIYDVTLTVTNDCGSVTATETLVIATEGPMALFEANLTAGCVPFEVTFENLSSANAETFEWSFPGGDPSSSTEENPTVTYNTPGTYDVTLTVTNQFGSDEVTFPDYITVDDVPVADYSLDITSNIVDFTNLSVNADTYLWSFGDGETSTDANPSYTYDQLGVYNGSLIATNDCGSDTIEFSIEIAVQLPLASFSAEAQEGCVPFEVQFMDMSTNEPTSWEWTFPGGDPATSNEQNPIVTYNAPGSYNVTLTVGNLAGNNTLAQNGYITVIDVPVAGFTIAGNMDMVEFTNTSTGATSYSWDFGDGEGSTLISPNHTYDSPGTYTVTLEATNECGTTTYSEEITLMFDHVTGIDFLDRMELYPNPNDGKFWLLLEGENLATTNVKVSLLTILGQTIKEEKLQINNNRIVKEFDIQELPKGVYILQLQSDNRYAYLRVVVD